MVDRWTRRYSANSLTVRTLGAAAIFDGSFWYSYPSPQQLKPDTTLHPPRPQRPRHKPYSTVSTSAYVYHNETIVAIASMMNLLGLLPGYPNRRLASDCNSAR